MIVNSFILIFFNIYMCVKAGLGGSNVSFSRQLSYTTKHKQDSVTVLKGSDLKSCIKQCKMSKDCKFANYMTRTKICRTALYFGKDAWNRDVIEETASGVVSWLKQVDETGTSCGVNAECQLLYCRPPPMFGSMSRFGNMVTVGAKKSYGCFHGGSGSPVMQSVTCTSGNQWDGLDVVCGYRLADEPYNGKDILYKPSTVDADQSAAISNCKREGAGLIQVTNGGKLDHIVMHLRSLGKSGAHWVDAKKVKMLTWKTSDGKDVPQGEDLWENLGWSRVINGVKNNKCATLSTDRDTLEPKACAETTKYVCEIY